MFFFERQTHGCIVAKQWGDLASMSWAEAVDKLSGLLLTILFLELLYGFFFAMGVRSDVSGCSLLGVFPRALRFGLPPQTFNNTCDREASFPHCYTIWMSIFGTPHSHSHPTPNSTQKSMTTIMLASRVGPWSTWIPTLTCLSTKVLLHRVRNKIAT